MHTEITKLFAEQADRVRLLTANITEKISASSVVLYSMRMTNSLNWPASPIVEGKAGALQISIDLLIVPEAYERKSKMEITRMVQQEQTANLTITCIVHSLPSVCKEIQAGNLFFNRVQEEGMLLYGSSSNWPSCSTDFHNILPYVNQANTLFHKRFDRAYQLQMDAENLLRYHNNIDKAFIKLCRSVNSWTLTLLEIFSGYRPQKQNILEMLLLLQHTGFNYETCLLAKDAHAKPLFLLLAVDHLTPKIGSTHSSRREDLYRLRNLVQELLVVSYKYYRFQLETWLKKAEKQPIGDLNKESVCIPLFSPLRPAS